MSDSFNYLKSSFNIIFAHVTNVPGLSDSLKHIEGFHNITEIMDVRFLKNEIKNSRSQMIDCDDPASLIGLDLVLKKLNSEAKDVLKSTKSIEIPVNFNFLVSGTKDAHKGSPIVHKLSIQDKIDRLTDGLEQELKVITNCELMSDVVNYYKSLGYQTIVFKFSVSHISIISHFIGIEQSLIKEELQKYSMREFSSEFLDDFVLTIHFRQGDTAVFRTSDNQLISAWGNWRNPKNKSSNPEFIEDLELAAYKQYKLEDFLFLLDFIVLKAKDKGLPLTVNFISDGFSRGVQRIEDFSADLGLSDLEVDNLKKWSINEENMYKELLLKYAERNNINIEIRIGETKDSFLFSVSSIANSNILIAGVGGFSRTMFDYMGFKKYKLLVQDFDKDNICNKLEQISQLMNII